MVDVMGPWAAFNRPTVERMNPGQVAQAAGQIMTYQDAKQAWEERRAQREQKEQANAIFKESGGDWRKAAGLATERGLMDYAGHFGELADKRDTAMAQAQKAMAEMDENQRKAALGHIQEFGKLSKMVLSQPPAMREKAFQFAAKRMGRNDLVYDENELMMGAQLADALGSEQEEVKPMTDIAKLNWELKRGLISPQQHAAAIQRATTHAPGINVNTGERLPPGWRVDPANPGRWIPIPGGPNDPARPGVEKPLTDSQANALGFGVRAMEANAILNDIEGKGGNTSNPVMKLAEKIPGGQYAIPEYLQQYNQAKQNFITAVLRKESGAVISANEFAAEDQKYFPQPGDTDGTRAQKARARQTAVKLFESMAGRPLTSVNTDKPIQPQQPKGPTGAVSLDDYLKSQGF